MSWSSVQLKYELIRVTEILKAWAKFKKSKIASRVIQIRDILLTEKLGTTQLNDFRHELISIVQSTNDPTLIADLKAFTTIKSFSHQSDSGVPEYS